MRRERLYNRARGWMDLLVGDGFMTGLELCLWFSGGKQSEQVVTEI